MTMTVVAIIVIAGWGAWGAAMTQTMRPPTDSSSDMFEFLLFLVAPLLILLSIVLAFLVLFGVA